MRELRNIRTRIWSWRCHTVRLACGPLYCGIVSQTSWRLLIASPSLQMLDEQRAKNRELKNKMLSQQADLSVATIEVTQLREQLGGLKRSVCVCQRLSGKYGFELRLW